MTFELPKLGYAFDALEPHIDARTMEVHYTKHHAGYTKNLNAALEKHPLLEKKSAKELLRNLQSVPEDIRTAVKNNGGGYVNHTFFWRLLKKNVSMPKSVQVALDGAFGSVDAFKQQFAAAAATRFGSGWAWLVKDAQGTLSIMSTPNQDSPLSIGKTPILGLDVWEHGYYLQWGPNRAGYIDAWWNLVNWEQVHQNYIQVM